MNTIHTTKSALLLGLLLTFASSFSFAATAATNKAADNTAINNKTTDNKIINNKVSGYTAIPGNAMKSAAASSELTPRMKTYFHRDFPGASVLNTEIGEKFIKVTFSMDSQVLQAYYANNGQLIGVVHNIISSELPVELQLDLKQQYGDHWISELFEIKSDNGSTYYISLESADEVLNLRATADNGWEVYSRIEKI